MMPAGLLRQTTPWSGASMRMGNCISSTLASSFLTSGE